MYFAGESWLQNFYVAWARLLVFQVCLLSERGVYNGSNPSLFEQSLCGPAYFITRADNLLRLRMVYYAWGYFYYAYYRTPTAPFR